MSSRFINGAKYAFSQSVAAAVVVSAISNASPAVASASATPTEGDIVVLTSGWTELTDTVARVGTVVPSTSFEVEGVDTSDDVRYPTGEGAGAYAVVSDFITLSQVRDITTDGGDQQFFTFQYVEDPGSRQRQKPTFKNAQGDKIVMDYDPDLAWYDALIELDRLRAPVVLRETLPNGELIYTYGYLSFNKVPTKQINENMTVTATFSAISDPIRYAAA